MAFQQLFSLVPPDLIQKRRNLVARWTETGGSDGWEQAPDYGTFVDDAGMVVSGIQPARVTLGADDPRHLEFVPEVQASLGFGSTVVFLDWGRQSLSWEEIFDLWDAWESQGMILDCGAVGVPWRLADRWVAPGWVAFRGDFDGAPLSTVVRSSSQDEGAEGTVRSESSKTSFLARALEIRGESDLKDLPMLPFTLENLEDPGYRWPQGVA